MLQSFRQLIFIFYLTEQSHARLIISFTKLTIGTQSKILTSSLFIISQFYIPAYTYF